MEEREPEEPGPQILAKIVATVVLLLAGCFMGLCARWLMGH